MSDDSMTTVQRQSAGETGKQQDSIYEPLDTTTRQGFVSTRIVTILPELSEQGRIQCKLEPFFVSIEGDQDPAPKYNALSYVWGSETPTETIEVNGKATVIRENLWYALERIRPIATATGRIWIDALCIDQTNNAERNHQVRFMGVIYSQAQVVVVWLGEGLGAYDHFWDVAEEIQSRNSELNLSFRASFISLLEEHGYTLEEWEKCWWEFFKLEYWSRAWVVQEYRLAKSVLLLTGTRAIADHTLALVGVCMHQLDDLRVEILENHPSSEGGYYRVAQPRFDWVAKRGSIGPAYEREVEETWQAFLGAATSDCADPRDRVYSHLSLVRFGQSFLIDYTEDVVTLFVRTILFCFDTDKPEGQSCGWWVAVAKGLGLQLESVDVWWQLLQRASLGGSHRGFWFELAIRVISMEVPTFKCVDSKPIRQECPRCKDVVKLCTEGAGNWRFCCMSGAVYFDMGVSWHMFFDADVQNGADSEHSRTVFCVLHIYKVGPFEYVEERMVQILPIYTNSRLHLSLLTCLRVLALVLGSAPDSTGTSTDGTLPIGLTSLFTLAEAGLSGEKHLKGMQPALQIASDEDSRYRKYRE